MAWLQLEGGPNPSNNEGRSITDLDNDTLCIHIELPEHLWVRF